MACAAHSARLSSPPRARRAPARVIADRLAPAKPPPEVRALVARLDENAAEARREVGRISGLAIDMVDCRWAAPFLAGALADSDAGVRYAAANALYYLFDLTPHAVVKLPRPALERALTVETDPEASEEIRAALKAAG